MVTEIFVENEEAMLTFGKQLAAGLQQGAIVFLLGELGAGKTTLVRGFLRARGYKGTVKSPTFTLMEPYELDGQKIYHFDLYRLSHPDELEYMGIRDYFDNQAICFIEWPEHGAGLLPDPVLKIHILHQDCSRLLRLETSESGLRSLINKTTV